MANIGNLSTIANGMPVIRAGFLLRKKQPKTPQEAAAADAFLKSLVATVVMTLVCMLGLAIAVVICLSQHEGSRVSFFRGHVAENGEIWYIDNVKYTLQADDVGLDPARLSPGDMVYLTYDETGITGGLYQLPGDGWIIGLVVSLCVACAVMIGFAIYFRRAAFTRPWREWCRENGVGRW